MASIEIRCFEGLPDDSALDQLVEINQVIFGFNETSEQLGTLLRERQDSLLILAFHEGRPVAFKVGFREEPGCFESWRGGVLETVRRTGIARELMRVQHDWCVQRNFRVIKTITNSDNTGMLILNLRSGFEITGTFVNRRKRLKVLQQKWLDP